MFRLLHLEFLRKGKLPEACDAYLKKLGNRPKFQNCIEKTAAG
jgi:hypothetical protein